MWYLLTIYLLTDLLFHNYSVKFNSVMRKDNSRNIIRGVSEKETTKKNEK